MLTYVLDSSAVLRFSDNETGVDRVRERIRLAIKGECRLVIPAVNWGEVIYILAGRTGPQGDLPSQVERMKRSVSIIDATSDRAVHAGLLKNRYNIAYADAFGVEIASDSPDHILVTADYGVKSAEQDVRIESLPAKPKP